MLQTVWDWRPMVFLTGPTNSGKSFLHLCIKKLIGHLGLFLSSPSEAGLRQFIGRTAKVPMIDECEHSRERQKIFETFRTSSRGGQTARGTVNHQGAGFGFKHIPWFGAIETGLKREADLNRFILLELNKIQRTPNRKPLALPPQEMISELGVKMLAVAIRYWRPAVAFSRDLKDRSYSGVDPRLIESYAVPVAFMSVVIGCTVNDAEKMLLGMLAERGLISDRNGTRDAQVESDETALTEAILSSVVRLERGQQMTVSDLLHSNSYDLAGDQTPDEALRSVGIRTLEPKPGRPERRVFIAPKIVLRYLLRDTDYSGMNIGEILMRIEGAEKCPQRMGKGPLYWGISIPLKAISSSDDITTNTP